MTIEDYDKVYALWASLPGMGLHPREDSRDGMDYYLNRNPDSCFVAEQDGQIIGAVLFGNDGRRGYINHLAVAQNYQGRGIAKALLNAGLAAMRREGIAKCSLMVYRNNEQGNAFWDRVGSTRRDEVIYRNIGTEEIK